MSKRSAILERLADFVLAKGLEAATLRAMATAAEQSDRMLLYYFKDKDEIVSSVLDLLAARLMDHLQAQTATQKLPKDALHAALDHVVLTDEMWPFLRLRLELMARVARGDPLFAPAGQAIANSFHDWIKDQLATPDAELRAQHATEIMIGLEGVIALKAAGMEALVRELL